jgi:hypothetical protein
MTDQEVTQEQYDQLVDDIGYLQDEAEALKYVIDQVPYTEKPPDGYSIYSLLKLLDHAQVNYFRPVVESVFAEHRTLNLSDFDHFQDSFSEPGEDEPDINRVLNKIIKHRAALINVFNKIPLIDWERGIKDSNGDIISLYNFAGNMVKSERKILKEIADLVLIYQNEKLARREIDSRSEQRKPE